MKSDLQGKDAQSKYESITKFDLDLKKVWPWKVA